MSPEVAVASIHGRPIGVAPWRLSGTVVGAALNDPAILAALGDAVHAPPYKAPPKAPVLYVKPRNTFAPADAPFGVAEGFDAVEAGVTVALVIGRTACRVSEAEALAHVAGVAVALDFTLPHESWYRPAARFKARDGSFRLGEVRPVEFAGAAAAAGGASMGQAAPVFRWRVAVDGREVLAGDSAGYARSPARLIADVSEFMTLHPGDVLLLGVPHGCPRVKPGQRVRVEVEGLGAIECAIERERVIERIAPAAAAPRSVAPPRTARVAVDGRIHAGVPHERGVQLADGRIFAEDAVTWLPPVEPGTIIALGLNYADHVAELSKELTRSAADEPLVFFKTAGSVIGHRGTTPRPADATFMHYECELAVVIGHPAHHVKAADAMRHVAGYTVANDWAVRDYLENWLRPNLRVKNRDGGTVLGPWFVAASEIADPHALELSTFVDGVRTQHGHTSRMVHRVPELIEYLSGFMTLLPGDVILTGTPEGVVDIPAESQVVCNVANTLDHFGAQGTEVIESAKPAAFVPVGNAGSDVPRRSALAP